MSLLAQNSCDCNGEVYCKKCCYNQWGRAKETAQLVLIGTDRLWHMRANDEVEARQTPANWELMTNPTDRWGSLTCLAHLSGHEFCGWHRLQFSTAFLFSNSENSLQSAKITFVSVCSWSVGKEADFTTLACKTRFRVLESAGNLWALDIRCESDQTFWSIWICSRFASPTWLFRLPPPDPHAHTQRHDVCTKQTIYISHVHTHTSPGLPFCITFGTGCSAVPGPKIIQFCLGYSWKLFVQHGLTMVGLVGRDLAKKNCPQTKRDQRSAFCIYGASQKCCECSKRTGWTLRARAPAMKSSKLPRHPKQYTKIILFATDSSW